MNEELEKKWREEFEDFYKDVDSAPNFKTNKYGDYSCIYAQENWSTYLAASKKAQEEIKKRDELLNAALKHLDTAYKWGLWLYESEDYQEMEDEDEKDNMGSDLDIVCSFLNTNKGSER